MASRNFNHLEMFNHGLPFSVKNGCVKKDVFKKHSDCFDIYAYEDYNIFDYLNAADLPEKERRKEISKRLVFFMGETEDKVKPYCYHTDYIQHIDPLTSVYTTGCKKHPATGQWFNTSAGVDIEEPLIKLDFERPVYLYLSDFLKSLKKSTNRIFLILPSDDEYERTASINTLDYINGVANQDMARYVSADHCQAGTNKRVSNITVCPKKIIDSYMKASESDAIDKPSSGQRKADEKIRKAASLLEAKAIRDAEKIRKAASRLEALNERKRKTASRREEKAAERSRKAASRREAKEARKSRKVSRKSVTDSEDMPLGEWFKRRSSRRVSSRRASRKSRRVSRKSKAVTDSEELPLGEWFKRRSSRRVSSRKASRRVSSSRKPSSRRVSRKGTKRSVAKSVKDKIKKSVRAKVSRVKKSVKKDARGRLVDELLAECKEEGDVVLLEDFVDMSLKDLKSVVKTGKGAKKNCYKAETLYNILQTAAEQNIPVKDPLTNERLTKEEIKDVMAKMRKVMKRAETPRAAVNMNPFAYIETIPLPNEPGYVTLYYVNYPEEKNLGVIPADARLTKKILNLYEAGRLLRLAPGGVYEAPRIHLHKTLDYWKTGGRERLINKMIDEIDQLL
jgi:hypothetical protein